MQKMFESIAIGSKDELMVNVSDYTKKKKEEKNK